MSLSKPKMIGLAVPVIANSVEAPILTYGDGPASINFAVDDDAGWARVTFEKLDSLRVSRGEYGPHPSDWREGDPHHWVSVVTPSPWLRERYQYEKKHYGSAYGFGGNVDEMLVDFAHYVFSFHDQFVEAICAGIWFEMASDYIGARPPNADHPLADLPPSSAVASFQAHGIECEVRRNSRPVELIVKDAELCSQKLFQFGALIGGSAGMDWTLDLRVRDGRPRSRLTSYSGKVEAVFDGIATIEQVRPRLELWLEEVGKRRAQMGRA